MPHLQVFYSIVQADFFLYARASMYTCIHTHCLRQSFPKWTLPLPWKMWKNLKRPWEKKWEAEWHQTQENLLCFYVVFFFFFFSYKISDKIKVAIYWTWHWVWSENPASKNLEKKILLANHNFLTELTKHYIMQGQLKHLLSLAKLTQGQTYGAPSENRTH